MPLQHGVTAPAEFTLGASRHDPVVLRGGGRAAAGGVRTGRSTGGPAGDRAGGRQHQRRLLRACDEPLGGAGVTGGKRCASGLCHALGIRPDSGGSTLLGRGGQDSSRAPFTVHHAQERPDQGHATALVFPFVLVTLLLALVTLLLLGDGNGGHGRTDATVGFVLMGSLPLTDARGGGRGLARERRHRPAHLPEVHRQSAFLWPREPWHVSKRQGLPSNETGLGRS